MKLTNGLDVGIVLDVECICSQRIKDQPRSDVDSRDERERSDQGQGVDVVRNDLDRTFVESRRWWKV